jgi:hypothetical protein
MATTWMAQIGRELRAINEQSFCEPGEIHAPGVYNRDHVLVHGKMTVHMKRLFTMNWMLRQSIQELSEDLELFEDGEDRRICQELLAEAKAKAEFVLTSLVLEVKHKFYLWGSFDTIAFGPRWEVVTVTGDELNSNVFDLPEVHSMTQRELLRN